MKAKRKYSILISMLLVISMVLLAGCGGAKAKPEDALSASVNLLQNKDIEGYAKVTGADKDKIEKIYDEQYKTLDTVGLGQKFYEDIFAKVFAKTKYEVKDTKEESDGKYVLTVEVEPLKLFTSNPDKIKDDLSKFMKEERKKVESGEVQNTPEEINKKIMKVILTSAAETVEKDPKYDEKKTIKVEVLTDNEGHATMDEKNASQFISSLLDNKGIDEMF